MRRFSFGDDEEEEEDEDMETEMEIQRAFPEDFITMTQFGNPNADIMNLALRVCEKSWLWRFRGVSSKLKRIEETFFRLKDLFDD